MPALDLFLHEERIGQVEPASRDRSRVNLTIDPAYRQTIVLTESFATLAGRRPSTDAVSSFLGGYVPEGNHRAQMASRRQIDDGDLFALLREFGGSIAGALTTRLPDEPQRDRPRYEPLDDTTLSARLQQALTESDQGIPDDSRSTLPGYQPKVLVARFDDQWVHPHGRAHSTHILKPQVPSRPSRIFDEYYSHLLTRAIGLSTFESHLSTAGRTTYLAIERFDRTVEGETVRLHHQEDLAQALGLDWRSSEVKFQDPRWPGNPKRATARRIAELLGSIPGSHAAVAQWIRQLTFHVAVGNNDAHAKNVALMHFEHGTELAQVYDALPNLFQDGLIDRDLALAIDGQFDQRRISSERILAEVASWQVIRASDASVLVEETLAALDGALAATEPPAGASPRMVERLRWNTGRLLAGQEISTPKR